MTTSTPRNPTAEPRTLSELLDPRSRRAATLVFGFASVITFGVLTGSAALLPWKAALLALAIAGVPWLAKWRTDLRSWGLALVTLAVMIVAQGLHTAEHVLQLVQVYLLDWPAGRALGLISAANVEWIHLAWNLLVLAGVLLLMVRGVRSPWAWVLLAWSLLHTGEHAYLFVRSLVVVAQSNALGLEVLPVTQALPGILGRDGVLASQTWCGRIPGLTTAPRVVVHFVWNAGEMALLLATGHAYLRHRHHLTSPVPPRRDALA
jgi:hypothetical protein